MKFGGFSGSWERWTGVVFLLFDHSLVVELVGARALTAGLERSPNWLWRTSFRAFGSIVVSLSAITSIIHPLVSWVPFEITVFREKISLEQPGQNYNPVLIIEKQIHENFLKTSLIFSTQALTDIRPYKVWHISHFPIVRMPRACTSETLKCQSGIGFWQNFPFKCDIAHFKKIHHFWQQG